MRSYRGNEMNIDINNLNETEVTALMARIKQLDGEEASTTPYLKACVIELAESFRTMPKAQLNSLIKVRNELLFLRLHFIYVVETAIEHHYKDMTTTDEEATKLGVTLAAIDGILEILKTLQESTDERLLELSPNIFKDGYYGTLN